jgi:hypothetical protein
MGNLSTSSHFEMKASIKNELCKKLEVLGRIQSPFFCCMYFQPHKFCVLIVIFRLCKSMNDVKSSPCWTTMNIAILQQFTSYFSHFIICFSGTLIGLLNMHVTKQKMVNSKANSYLKNCITFWTFLQHFWSILICFTCTSFADLHDGFRNWSSHSCSYREFNLLAYNPVVHWKSTDVFQEYVAFRVEE